MANIFGPGVSKTAAVTITVNPSGVALALIVSVGTSPSSKIVTSTPVNFTSTGAAQVVSVPLTMPAASGAYNVYLDIQNAGVNVPPEYQGVNGVSVVVATIGLVTWN